MSGTKRKHEAFSAAEKVWLLGYHEKNKKLNAKQLGEALAEHINSQRSPDQVKRPAPGVATISNWKKAAAQISDLYILHQGNCTDDPPPSLLRRLDGAPLVARTPGQCVILAQSHLLALTESQSLVENLYIRYSGRVHGEPTNTGVPTLLHVHGGDMYIRNVCVQGDGLAPCRGFIAYPVARVLYKDGAITHMVGNQTEEGHTIVAVAVRASPTYFLKTNFSHIHTAVLSPVIAAAAAAPIKLQECSFSANNTAKNKLRAFTRSRFFADDVDGLSVAGEDITEVSPPKPLSAARGSKFLTDTDQWFVDIQKLLNGPVNLLPLEDALKTIGGVGMERTGKGTGSPLPPCVWRSSFDPKVPYGSSSQGSYDNCDDDSGLDTWVIIVIVAGIVAVLAAVIGVIIYRRRNQARQEQLTEPKNQLVYYPQPVAYVPYPVYGSQGGLSAHPSGYVAPWGYPPTLGTPSESSETFQQKMQAVPGSPGQASSRTQSSAGGGRIRVEARPARWCAPYSDAGVTFTDDFAMPQYTDLDPSPYHTISEESMTRATNVSHASQLSRQSRQSTRSGTRTLGAGRGEHGSPVGPVPEGASVPELMDLLARQLDGMHAIGKPIKERFLPLGEAHRRMGGQGMVQFARDVRDERDYAIKLFVSRKAFDSETALYGDAVLWELLPKIEAMTANEDGAEGDAHGTPLPPFIIMEKGEALDEWSRRAKPDLFHSVAMLANISRCLSGMHEAGYVHRDLKPGNVMWLPRENRWTIIDFGCVARTGESASICYSLRYTAPEVIQALHKKQRTIVPQASLDSWALGVMAFELLTGKPAFQPLVEGTQRILAQLLGEQELPWEGSRAAPETMGKLRSLRTPVMALLERDPTRRRRMQQFCESCDDIFGTRTYKPAI